MMNPARQPAKCLPTFYGWLLLLMPLALLSFISGCETDDGFDEIQSRIQKVNEIGIESNPIDEAFQYIPQVTGLQSDASVEEISQSLKTWSSDLPVSKLANQWRQPKIVETLPDDILDMGLSNDFANISFGRAECRHMFTAKICSDITRWVLDRPYRDPLFSDWVSETASAMPEVDGVRLNETVKLFDWTVRNVWISDESKSIENTISNPTFPPLDSGRGYRQPPWLTLLAGRGDSLERCRVFAQLLFQRSIPMVVIGVRDGSQLGLSLIGIPIGKELYLFEPRMGIPLPGPNGKGIATLAQAKSDSSILRRARLPGWFDYCIEQSDLQDIVLLLECEPSAMNRSMQVVQGGLVGENRMRVYCNPDELKKEVQLAAPNEEVRLWGTPWLSNKYEAELQKRLSNVNTFSQSYVRNYGMFFGASFLPQARLLHFDGSFDTEQDRNALESYLGLRLDEESLDDLHVDAELQRSLGIVRQRLESQPEFFARIEIRKAWLRLAKYDIGMYLSMLQFDLGRFDSARNWAEKRTLNVAAAEKWHDCCWYQIARSYEQEGDFETASQWYRKEGSAQEHGNRIRLRLLARKLPEDENP